MSARPRLGIALPPDEVFWQHNRALIEERAELFEITPEATWRAGAEPDAQRAAMVAFARRAGRPFVAHGVLGSIGAAVPPPRRATWLAALRRDVGLFGCQWLSEHLGFADAGGVHVGWPLPLPPTDEAVAVAAAALRELQHVHPVVAFENNADLFCLGDPLAQPQLFARIAERADAHLLLDLHNAFAFCRNTGTELRAWLAALPWPRVLELHLSGGSDSDPGLLANGRSLRLDSHDGAVPAELWRELPDVLARAVNLRAVVLEWYPDAMDAAAAAVFAADFERARSVVC